jgi:predicted metal-dependent peptidase
MEAKAAPKPLCPLSIKKAQEDLSIVTTLLLSPGSGASSPKTFYAHFLMRMNVVFTNFVGGREMNTLGVSITDKINLYVNSDYFNSLDYEAKIDVVEHEVEHVVYMHPLRAKDYIGSGLNDNTHMLFNYSTDANINQSKLKSANKYSWVTIDGLNKQLQQKGSSDRLNENDAAEVHYEILKKNFMNPDEDGSGKGMADDHGVWSESTGSKEVAEAIIRDTANKAQSATGIGNMPEGMLREISNMNKASVNWRRQLHQAATSALRYDFLRTRNRRNRRDIYGDGLRLQGRKKKPKLRIISIGDSSGSVSDEAYAQYFAEIGEIQKATDAEILIIDADCAVQDVYAYDPKAVVKRTGYGGTAYSPGIEKAKELGADLIIYFGDMDSADTPTDPGIPFIWAVVGPQNPPANFGRTVRVIVEGERRR